MDTSNLAQLNQLLSKKENVEILSSLVDALPVLHKSVSLLQQLEQTGGLDNLFSLVSAVANSKGMLSDEMVAGAASLASNAIELISKLSSPEMQRIISSVLDHGVELEETIAKSERVKGLLGIMKQLRDPDVQSGLAVLFALLKILGRYVKG